MMGENRYMGIAREISARIRRGEYKSGQPLPTRMELAKEFNVARATIDRCIEHLTGSMGILTSRHGSGTYVNEAGTRRHHVAMISMQDLRMPQDAAFHWQYFSYRELTEKAAREKLLKFEGLIWFRPEEQAMTEWLPDFQGKIPQVIVNRTIPGIPCVSTDHRGAYREITLERLRQHPGIKPFFLKMEKGPAVSRYRESGFIDACREMGCFYEQIYMPEDFHDRLEVLRHYNWGTNRPILLVSDSLQNTGAVMAWMQYSHLTWQKDIFYSDFDNDLPEYIWGRVVTSYIQPDSNVLASALKKLEKMLNGGDDEMEHLLLFPTRRNGNT